MINFEYRPETYFTGSGPTTLLAKLLYPESQWGEEISIFVNVIDGIYYYEAVDFYGNEIQLNPEISEDPLTLQELIVLIETMDSNPKNSQGHVEITLSGTPEAESPLYPELEKYFSDKRKYYGLR